MRKASKITGGVLAAAAAVVLIAGIVLGGWAAGWWFTNQDVNRESHVLRNSFANQQTVRDQITQNIGNVLSITTQIAQSPSTAPQLRAQRAAVVGIICDDAAQVTGDPLQQDQAQFVAANCEAGAISPSSPYQANQ